MDGLPSRFTSRKFILAVAAFVSAVLIEVFNLDVDPETVFGAAAVILAFIGVEGWADVKGRETGLNLQERFLYSQYQLFSENLKSEVLAAAEGNLPDGEG